jgi:hypothetical protein
MGTIILNTPDYFQEHLPFEKWNYHYEARRNYGTAERPNWQTIAYGKSEKEVKDKLTNN